MQVQFMGRSTGGEDLEARLRRYPVLLDNAGLAHEGYLIVRIYMHVAYHFATSCFWTRSHTSTTLPPRHAASSVQRLHLRPSWLIPAPTSTPLPSLADGRPHLQRPRRPCGGNTPAAQPERSLPRWLSPSGGYGTSATAAPASPSVVSAAPLSLMAGGGLPGARRQQMRAAAADRSSSGGSGGHTRCPALSPLPGRSHWCPIAAARGKVESWRKRLRTVSAASAEAAAVVAAVGAGAVLLWVTITATRAWRLSSWCGAGGGAGGDALAAFPPLALPATTTA